MDKQDRSEFWFLIRMVIYVTIFFACLAGVGRVAGLFWFPWEIKMQTGMIRASNSYVTTQQAALRQFRGDYESAATDGQRAAIVRQMREIADTIPDDVQPDIRSFLSNR
jgi:hypothetical protein